MLTLTRTVTVNAAFLQDIKADNDQLRALIAGVREMCKARATTRRWLRRFPSLLAELRDQLAMHFALEETYGYFDDPVSVAPHLSEQADRLRCQHADFYEEICRLAESGEDILSSTGQVNRMRRLARDFLEFHRRLQHHERRETDLIFQAYNVDVGD